MAKKLSSGRWVMLAAMLFLGVCWYEDHAPSAWSLLKDPDDVSQLKRFVALKATQAKNVPGGPAPEIKDLFQYAENGDWLTFSNAYWRLGERFDLVPDSSAPFSQKLWMTIAEITSSWLRDAGWETGAGTEEPGVRGVPWETAQEVWGAFDNFVASDESYSRLFGREIMDSVPAGSIYFAGTDPGRFIVTAMSKSQPDGTPFFTIGQQRLDNEYYRDYLRSMYGNKLFVPTDADAECAFEEFQHTVAADPPGRAEVFITKDRLAQMVFDRNPGKEFFVEEGYPMEWMYPLLEPRGLIFKLNREPADSLSDEILQRDHDFWVRQIQPMIGDWVKDRTPLAEILMFANKVFIERDFTGFTGDRRFVQGARTARMFSHERVAIAGLYAWRMHNATNSVERERMAGAADFAFRQALALCPYSADTVYRYVNFLLERQRLTDAIAVATTAAKMGTESGEGELLNNLVQQLEARQKDGGKS